MTDESDVQAAVGAALEALPFDNVGFNYDPSHLLWQGIDYIGDINILPPRRFFNPFRILAFLSEDEILDLVDAGERATWPHIEMIRIQTHISRTLADILEEYDEEHVQHVKAAMRKKAG